MATTNNFTSFDDMEFLSFELLKGIFDYGFKVPSKIQNLVIKDIYDKKDMIAQSQSGTGKTGAFTIGSLSRIKTEEKYPQVLILATARELATQIYTVFTNIAKHMNINISLCIGGTKVKINNKNDPYKHIRTSQVLIGTPGRILDYINNKAFDPTKLELFVMDEADALLKDDFIEQVRTIITSLDAETQICIFSATYHKDIIELSQGFLKEPVNILLKREDYNLSQINQYKVYVKFDEYKYGTLVDLYKNLLIGQSIIFVNSVNNADELTNKLEADGYVVGKIHGSLETSERMEVLKNFRLGIIRVLISTDVLSRGIDIEQVGIVINYDIPRDKAQYIHRIGRSGRYGKVGVAINFVTDRDYKNLNDIQRYMNHVYNVKIEDMPEFKVIIDYLSGIKGYIKLKA